MSSAARDNDPQGDLADMLDKLLADRWSCRAFRPDPLPQRTIASMIEAAQRAPSWCNTQPWQLIVTSGAETNRFRLALQEHIGGGIAPASDIDWPNYQGRYLERRREVGWMLYSAVGVERGDRESASRQAFENFRLFGAPHLAVVTSDRSLGTYGVLDCGIFIQSFLLAAAARGIATIPQAALAGHSHFLRSHFGISEDRLVVCGISFGLADRDHPANGFRAPRVALSETVQWWGDR